MPDRGTQAEDQADNGADRNCREPDADGNRQSRRYQRGNRCVLGEIVADAQNSAEKIEYIPEELNDYRLIETVLRLQCRSLVIVQLLIVER